MVNCRVFLYMCIYIYIYAYMIIYVNKIFWLSGKEPSCNARDLGLIPGLGRSSGEVNGYPLQYSGLENSMDCTVHGVTKSRTN